MQQGGLHELSGVTNTETHWNTHSEWKALLRSDVVVPRGESVALSSLYKAPLAEEVVESDIAIIVGVFELLVFRRMSSLGSPDIRDVLLFVRDGYTAGDWQTASDLYEATGPLCEVSALSRLIAVAVDTVQPGSVVAVNLRSGELEATAAMSHPHTSRPPASASANEATSRRLGECFLENGPLEPRSARGQLSSLSRGQLAGLVRLQRLDMNEFSVPASRAWMNIASGRELVCGGVHLQSGLAEDISLYEVAERFQVAYCPFPHLLTYAASEVLDTYALTPDALFYPLRSNCSLDLIPIYWAPAYSLSNDVPVLVPAQELWFDTDRLSGENILIRNTTNGCAVGASPSDAAVYAALEVVERDSFLLFWYLRRRLKLLPASFCSSAPTTLVLDRLEQLGCPYTISFFDLTTDINVPSVLAVARPLSSSRPQFLCAASARPTYAAACYSALKELQNWLASVGAEMLPNHDYHTEIDHKSGPEQHKRAFFGGRRAREVQSLLTGTYAPANALHAAEQRFYNLDRRQLLTAIADSYYKVGCTMALVDMTHPRFAEQSLYCVKAVVAGAFPMWYGLGNERWRLTERLQSLWTRWEKAGLCEDTATVNVAPHPFG